MAGFQVVLDLAAKRKGGMDALEAALPELPPEEVMRFLQLSDEQDETTRIHHKADLGALHELEAAFHHAGSYGGNIEEMMSLWAEGSTFTSGPNTYVGKDAIRSFFLAAGPFQNNWVGLTKAFVFTADIHGDTAQISFQCDFADPSVTPAVIRANSNISGTVKKIHGEWFFWRITGSAAAL